jgi:Protein of unknown function DUF262/Protein of unknown function (DUF1524)
MTSLFGDPPDGLSSQIHSIAEVLMRKPGLKVPRYQRPYTWSEREVRQLLQDLWRAFKRQAPFYFIGQIVLVRSGAGWCEISDGQQRLATLTMIFAYGRDRLPARADHFQQLIMDKEQPRLTLRNLDVNFFRGNVQERGHMAEIAAHVETGVESRDLMCAAARTIDQTLRKTDDKELDQFLSFVARACTLNVVDAAERGCAQTVFNALNMRGSPLSGADILKSDLLENADFSDAEADAAAAKWEQTEDMFERENFARLLYMMPFLLTGEQIVSPGDLGSFRAAVDRSGGVRKFLFEQLPRYAHALRAIFAGAVDVGAASEEVNRRIALMKQVEQWDWAPPAIAFLAAHAHEPERARDFFRALDRFTFACELSVIDNRVREERYAVAVKHVADDKMLYGPKGLELSESEHMKFIATLNRSRKRDRQRRLLMMRLEAAMPNGRLLTMTDDVTVEHVLPKGSSPWWNERFPDSTLRGELANLLGNLVLITDDQNKVADNKPYLDKYKLYFDPRWPMNAVTEDIRPISEWTLRVIEERHEKLVGILCKSWGLVRSD